MIEQQNQFQVGTRERARREQLLEYLGELIEPVTEGFEQINLDMTFTYLNMFDLMRVDNLCTSINICHIYGLKQSEYLYRGELATLVNSRKSRNAKSMDIITTMITKSDQKFKDETQENKGFQFFSFGKKNK